MYEFRNLDSLFRRNFAPVVALEIVEPFFLEALFWCGRGMLDVPRVRFISYPGLSAGDEPTPGA